MSRHITNLFSSLLILIATALLVSTALGCDDSSDTEPEEGGSGSSGSDSGSSAAGSGGTDNQGGDELPQCLPQDPPLADPNCYNPQCPVDLPNADPALKPKGNCCNTVDIKLKEDAMSAGETYDLELATYVSLPETNPNLTAPIILESTKTRQLERGDLTLLRFKNVPRSIDMEKDADGNPVPVEVTMESGTGRLNCDGTYSFFGPNAASKPVHGGTPDDASRWKPTVSQTNYYGPEGNILYDNTPEVTIAAGLKWYPRWAQDGLNFETVARFVSFRIKAKQYAGNHLSCFGSITKDGDWERAGHMWSFTPIEEADFSLIPSLQDQSYCGLFAMGAGGGNCSDTDQADWTVPPTGYCNEDGYCWIGNPDAEAYTQFWEELYDGQDGCDTSGTGDYPCCDPKGEDSALPPCNAFPVLSTFVMAAVEITDEPVNDPNESISWLANCQ